ncbi:MAG: hypothetical protein M3M99_06210, partial [Actinomycetota bacterium]|nr:hypothetical protein [Actinomycetota bacterium]
LFGGSNDDLVSGGLDNDFIKGNKGVDVMKGNDGLDRIFARDRRRDRRINCGPGANSAERAKRDKGKDPKARRC